MPVPNSKYESILCTSKCNSLSVLFHALLQINIFKCQTCVHTDFTIVRLGPTVKVNFFKGIESTISISLDVFSPFCATMTVERLSFAPLITLESSNFQARKRAKYIKWWEGDLRLLLISTDSHLRSVKGAKQKSAWWSDRKGFRAHLHLFSTLV